MTRGLMASTSGVGKRGGTPRFDFHRSIEEYITPGPTYKCVFADHDWEDWWPTKPGFGATPDIYRWNSWSIFAGWGSEQLRSFFQPDGTLAGTGAGHAEKVLPWRVDDFPGRPILGDQLTFSPGSGLWLTYHSPFVPDLERVSVVPTTPTATGALNGLLMRAGL